MRDELDIPLLNDDAVFSDISLEEEEANYKTLKKEKVKKRKKYRKIKIIGFLLLFVVYLLLDVSNVANIRVTNNKILTHDQVVEAVGITTKMKYLFINNIFKPKAKSDFIKSYKIKNNYLGEIVIDVTEIKLLGYVINEDSIDFISGDLKKIKLPTISDYIINLPKINISEEAFFDKVIKSLSELDSNIISRISEISGYATSYDKNMIKLMMDDGNQIFASLGDLSLISNYNNIIESIGGNRICIQLDGVNNSAYKFACP